MIRPPKSLFRYNNENHSEKILRIYNWLDNNPQPPFKIVMVPTNRCNLKCYCCPNSYAREVGRFKEEEELKDIDWCLLVRDALDMGAKEFYILGGGEPFVRKELTLNMIRMIKNHDKTNICEIITNLTLPDKNTLMMLVKCRLDRILVSIDSCKAKTHNYVRGTKGAFQDASKHLKLLQDLKKKNKTDKPLVQMNTVLSNKNFDQIIDIVKFAIKNGVSELALHPMREYEETRDRMQHLKLNKNQEKIMLEQIKEAQKIASKSDMYLNVSMIEETEQRNEKEENEEEESTIEKNQEKFLSPLCYEPFYSMFIDPLGNVNYCCAAGDGKPENNIRQGFEQIWYGSFFKKIRKMIIENKPTEKCSACGLLDMTAELKQDMKIYLDFLKRQKENGA